MENKNLIIIICVAIVICAIIGFGIFALTSTQTESVISADIPSSLTVGDTISISLIDSEGSPLKNKDIILTFTDSNNKSKNVTVKTNDAGIAKYKVKLESGKYTINGLFKEDGYKSSNFIKETKINDKAKKTDTTPTKSSSSSYSSSYSEPSYGSDESYATHGFSKQNGQWVDKNGNPAA